MDAEDERTEIDPRDNPWAMLAALPLFSGLPKHVVDEAVPELEWTSLPGGALLFETDTPPTGDQVRLWLPRAGGIVFRESGHVAA